MSAWAADRITRPPCVGARAQRELRRLAGARADLEAPPTGAKRGPRRDAVEQLVAVPRPPAVERLRNGVEGSAGIECHIVYDKHAADSSRSGAGLQNETPAGTHASMTPEKLQHVAIERVAAPVLVSDVGAAAVQDAERAAEIPERPPERARFP